MSEFIDYALSSYTLILFLIALGLIFSNKKKSRSYTFIVFVGLIFFITIIVLPMYQQNLAEENIASFKAGNDLECWSDTALFGSQKYLVNNKNSKLDGYNFIKESDGLMIRADVCE